MPRLTQAMIDDLRAKGRPGVKPPDVVNNPSHYTAGGIECIDYLKAKLSKEELAGFLRGNCLKYLSRAGLKGDAVEDFRKAEWYLKRLIELAST